MPSLSLSSFSFEDIPTAEVDAAEKLYGALAHDVRALNDVSIRTRVDQARVDRARALVQEATDLLAEDAPSGPAGIHYNGEGRSWNWGNAVVGVRNAVAPPVELAWQDDDCVHAALSLGAAYEGPPGSVHGGVSAMILDHLMGETASARHTRVTVTGTLTLRYVQPLPLGPVRMEARIVEVNGRKVTVSGWIAADQPDSSPAVEATGLFIVPRWAEEPDAPSGIGSLD
ncbi:PaaI family thioesterase [Nocardioides bizhenqiangii]|uniref:PaaI family thioesterase n=1 Tax=Nocardioides bizhenqiangii TaxID=3095076 RepID=A0ABZ0ZPU8_9ACTN|nr:MULTISPECIES: PaaI family thioesterase [unclassified Nocardioides]MDZ5619639.1 PaaI family thioesterase [Nocardioides sp. HM23]WQQ26349.1 PaaI family thioesterase [Nocardioides sp. HM61]